LDDPSALEAELGVLADRLSVLREAIAMLEQADTLRSDAAARLAAYRKNEEHLSEEMRKLERALVGNAWLRAGNGNDQRSDLANDLLDRLAVTDKAREASS
jgi:hypothetical protein